MSRVRNALGPLFALLAIQTVVGGPAANRFGRIVGGQLANKGQFRAIVSLATPGHGVHMCGASIIGPRHILTAAHCADSHRAIVVRAGIQDLRDTGNTVDRLVAHIYIHPDYVPHIQGVRPVQNDLAVLELQQPLPIGGRLQTLKLPIRAPTKGDYLTAGWGRNSPGPTYYQYELKTLTMAMCSRSFYGFPPGTICAYSDKGAICSGDSGSPFVRDGYLYGVTSTSRCTPGDPASFVNVYAYVDWIKSILSR